MQSVELDSQFSTKRTFAVHLMTGRYLYMTGRYLYMMGRYL